MLAFAKSPSDALVDLFTIKMKERESVTAFWKRFVSLLPDNAHKFIHQLFIYKLPARVQENHACRCLTM